MKKKSIGNPFSPYKSTYAASFDWPSDEFGFTIANKHLPVQAWLRNPDSYRPCSKISTYGAEYAEDLKAKDAPQSRNCCVDKQLSMEVRAMLTRYPYLLTTLAEKDLPPSPELIEHAYHRRGPSVYQDEISKEMCIPTPELLARVRKTKKRNLNQSDEDKGAGSSVTMEEDVDSIFDADDAKKRRNAFCFPRSHYDNKFLNPLCYAYGACEDPDTHFAGPPVHDTFRRAGWNREARGSTGKTEYQDYISQLAVEMVQKQSYNHTNNYYRGNPNKPR